MISRLWVRSHAWLALAASLCIVNSAAAEPLQEQAAASKTPSTGMLRYPDVSKDQIVFSYANDLWIVSRDGGMARPLASPAGGELFPRFNAEGTKIAFVGNYEGDRDLYVIDAAGGNAERMTYHPADELLCDWNPDGSLLYSSNGFAGLGRQPQLLSISKEKPQPKPLPVPYGTNGSLSADGKWLAYTPHSRDNRTWKRYRGGMASDVWLFNIDNKTSKQVTTWEGTDSIPMWHGKTLYYLSDNGPSEKLNIWKYNVETDSHTQITTFKDFDCKWPSIGPGVSGKGEIVLQNGSALWLIDLASGKQTSVSVTVPGDRPEVRVKTIETDKFIQSGDVSPKGKRAVVEARGDIWTLPAKNGIARNLTGSAGSAERMPSWSPDGRWIAYFSDATGEYELYTTQSDGRGETKQLTKDGKAWRYNPVWSPDSKHIVFTDKAGNIYLHTIEGGETKLVDTDPFAEQADVNWSHDSDWLTYAKSSDERAPTSHVWVYNVDSAEKTQVTQFFNCSSPVFDRKGEYIYCSSNRAFDRPKYEDVGTTFIYSDTEVLLAIPLRADIERPLLPKVDEVTWDDEEKKDSKDKDSEDSEEDEDKDSEDEDEDKDSEDEDEEETDDDSGDDEDEDDGISGEWAGEVTTEGVPDAMKNFTLTMTLGEGGSITGSVSTGEGSFDIITGKYDKASGSVNLVCSNGQVEVTIEGKIVEGVFTGTASFEDQAMEITAARSSSSTQEDSDDEKSKDDKDKKAAKKVTIDFDGIGRRIFQLPVSQGGFGTLVVNDKNQLIYARRGSRGGGGSSGIKLFDLKDDKKAEKTVVDGVANFAISANGKKLMVVRGRDFFHLSAAAGQKLKDKFQTKGMKSKIDPREEWRQIFMDAWRVERDFFYDPTMHGVDWEAVRDRYVKMIDDCSSRNDLGFVIGEMISEINVGHAYYRGAGSGDSAPAENVGLLGCRFAVDEGHYKIGEIFEGADWDTDARNPLRGAGIKEGDFILQVNGQALTADQNAYSAFVGMAGMTVTLTVSDDAKLDDDDKRIAIKPIASDNDLRFRAWIERNRKYIDEKTGGKVGYIYVVNTGVPGQNDLVRQLYGQLSKDALVIDDRWNGGGQIPTRFIELLNRPVTNYWAKRDGRDWTWPPDSHQGPKCMLINGMAGSGGDMFPALFRQNELGKLIGMRTWGGLVGISGGPQMVDGSSVTAPSFAYYEKDGTWGIEGHGVDPDMEVIDDPAKMIDGGDPQMDAAIKLMLQEIESSGYKAPERPKYPNRQKIGIAEDDK